MLEKNEKNEAKIIQYKQSYEKDKIYIVIFFSIF